MLYLCVCPNECYCSRLVYYSYGTLKNCFVLLRMIWIAFKMQLFSLHLVISVISCSSKLPYLDFKLFCQCAFFWRLNGFVFYVQLCSSDRNCVGFPNLVCILLSISLLPKLYFLFPVKLHYSITSIFHQYRFCQPVCYVGKPERVFSVVDFSYFLKNSWQGNILQL